MITDEADEVIKNFLLYLKIDLQSMRGSEFVFEYVKLLYCKFRRINFNRGGSYIDSPDWIENKKATINHKKKKKMFSICCNSCFIL